MSITNSLYIGVSGLDAHSDAISIVGDNIANASTIGFKSERADFADMLGGQLDGQNLGGGASLLAPETIETQGALEQTGNPLDMAISGNGFFVVNGSHDGQNGNFYTRDGQFALDSAGNVVDQNGMNLQGYTIDPTGAVGKTIGDLQLGARQSPPVATTDAKMSVNLDSSSTAMMFDPANPSTSSNYSTSETVYDSLGKAHQANVYFDSNGAGGWTWHAMVDGGDLAGGTKGTPTQIAAGTMTFNSTGALAAQSTTSSSASFVGATPNQAINFSFGDDIASGGTGMAGSTQYSGTSTVTSTDIDGHSAGNLTNISISSDGKVTGTFDNGQTIAIAQVALASFANEQGLTSDGNQLYSESATSGQALVDAAGTGGRGSISQGALEQSNVDLGNELVTLIAYQRAYEANSKTVTTADQMMQDTTNLKQ